MPKPVPTAATIADPAQDEETLVHEVYEAIAPHFARTRYKPWPLINRFLATLPPDAVGLDSGAGNGKYLPAAREAGAWAVAVDRSKGLLDIARTTLPEGAECVRGDICDVPWRRGVFDFAISVAALHHLSTPSRRCEAVKALLRPLRDSGRFFIYVWAWEQGENSRRKMGSLADGDGERVQDVLVPWVLKAEETKKPKEKKGRRREEEVGEEEPAAVTAPAPEAEEQVFHRYYHLFVKDELRELVERAAEEDGFVLCPGDEITDSKWLRIVDEGWEADNWWIEGEIGL